MTALNIVREVAGRTFELEPHWRGGCRVAETTGGARVPLTRDIDLPDEDQLTDEVLLALAEPRRLRLANVMAAHKIVSGPRRLRLANVMAAHKIVSGPDYPREDDYELLYSATPVGRYVVVSGDETYRWIHVVDTREDAAASVQFDIMDQRGNEYPRHPIVIIDLETGRDVEFKYDVVVTLSS